MNGVNGRCILQAEDDPNDIHLVQLVFKRAEIEDKLRVVRDGIETQDYLVGKGRFADRDLYPFPCLLLLDLKMPGPSGLDVLRWIRSQPTLKKLIVVLFSSSALAQDVDLAYELGANAYIQKPTDLQHLTEIAHLIKGWWLGCNHFPPIDVAYHHPSPVAAA